MPSKLKTYLFAITTSMLVLCCWTPVRADLVKGTHKTSIPAGTKVGEKVASVNGRAITRNQFDNAVDYQKEIAAMKGVHLTDEQLQEVKYQVLQNLINQELLYQQSQRSGIKIDKKEIDAAYEAKERKGKFKTDAEFAAALKKADKTVASYREEIKRGLAINRFIQNKFTDHTVISDSAAKKYYDSNPSYFQQPAEVRLSHILVRLDPNADLSKKKAAKAKIEQAMKRLKAGEKFATVAKNLSDDVNAKNNGGDLGYLSADDLSKPFQDAAFGLKEGQISNIITTSGGYHIIKLTGRRDARTISYKEAKSKIIKSLTVNEVDNKVSSYIKELKNKSTIVTYPISR